MTVQMRRDPESFAVESTRAKSSISGQLPPCAKAPIAESVPTAAFAGRTHPATDRIRLPRCRATRSGEMPGEVRDEVLPELRSGIPGSRDRVPPKVSTGLSPGIPLHSKLSSSQLLISYDDGAPGRRDPRRFLQARHGRLLCSKIIRETETIDSADLHSFVPFCEWAGTTWQRSWVVSQLGKFI